MTDDAAVPPTTSLVSPEPRAIGDALVAPIGFGCWRLTGTDVTAAGRLLDGAIDAAWVKARAKALELGEEQVEGSVEKRTVLQTYKLRSGYGYYSSYTDPNLVGKKPVPNDYKTVTLGIVRPAPGIVGLIRIYCDDLAGPDFQQLHGMIENLELLGPGGGRRRAQF